MLLRRRAPRRPRPSVVAPRLGSFTSADGGERRRPAHDPQLARCFSALTRPPAGVGTRLALPVASHARALSSGGRVAPSRSPPPQSKAGIPHAEYEQLKAFLEAPEAAGARNESVRAVVASVLEQHVHPGMPGQEATVLVMVADATEDPRFVLRVYEALRDAGVSPSPLTLEYTAAACASQGEWRLALEVIDCMHRAVDLMHPSVDIYEHAVAACLRDGKWMRAKQLLEEMRVYNLEASPELHAEVIKLCIAQHEPTASRALVDKFLQLFFTLDLDADEEDADAVKEEEREYLGEFFNASVAARSLPQARFFRDKMLDRGFYVSKDMYASLVELSALQRQWHDARVLVRQFVDRNAPAPVAAPRAKYARDIGALLGDMRIHGFDVSLPVYNAALRNYGKLVMFNEASALLGEMAERDVAPDATSFTAVLSACGARVEESERYFQQLQALVASSAGAASVDTFHSERSESVLLDACNAYMLVASRAQQYSLVLKRYHRLTDGSCSLPVTKDAVQGDVRIQSLVAIAQARTQDDRAMLRTFTRMKVQGLAPNIHVYGEAMHAYIRQDQWRHALMLFDHMRQRSLFPPESFARSSLVWDAVIQACAYGEDEQQRASALFDEIVATGALISPPSVELLVEMLVDVPCETLWEAFKRMESVHKVRKNPARRNPKVMNAHLKRAVEEKNVALAERVFGDALRELAMVPNAMSYALMLRLYASREDQAGFHAWASRLAAEASPSSTGEGVAVTVFALRAVLAHLVTLQRACESPAYLESIAALLLGGDYDGNREGLSAEQLAQVALDRVADIGHATDTLCLQNFLLVSQEPEHTSRVLSILEDALLHSDSEDEDLALSSRFLHTLFVSIGGAHPERVRALLLRLHQTLPRDLLDDALAAFCSCHGPTETLALLRGLVDSGSYELEDEHALLFLASCYSGSGGSADSKRPGQRDGEASQEKSLPVRQSGEIDAVVELCALMREQDAGAALQASTVAFLVQQVVELSTSSGSVSLASSREVDALLSLLSHSLAHFPPEQVREFLAQVIDREHLSLFTSVVEQ